MARRFWKSAIPLPDLGTTMKPRIHPPFRLSQSDSLKAKNYHRSFENLTVNILGAIAAYCMFPKKPCINLQ